MSSENRRVSGILFSADAVESYTLVDVLNTPFYGGWKYIMKNKLLSPAIRLRDGHPLVYAPMRALFSANTINDLVIMAHKAQADDLDELASGLATEHEKQYKIVETGADLGQSVAEAAGNVEIPGLAFGMAADLPFANGEAVDVAVSEILNVDEDAKMIFPVVTELFFEQYGDGWERTFLQLRGGDGSFGGFKMIDFLGMDPECINRDFISKFYEIRTFTSLKGKLNALRFFGKELAGLLWKALISGVSLKNLEAAGTKLYGNELRIIEVSNPYYHCFMKDIDTFGDYQAYLRATRGDYDP